MVRVCPLVAGIAKAQSSKAKQHLRASADITSNGWEGKWRSRIISGIGNEQKGRAESRNRDLDQGCFLSSSSCFLSAVRKGLDSAFSQDCMRRARRAPCSRSSPVPAGLLGSNKLWAKALVPRFSNRISQTRWPKTMSPKQTSPIPARITRKTSDCFQSPLFFCRTFGLVPAPRTRQPKPPPSLSVMVMHPELGSVFGWLGTIGRKSERWKRNGHNWKPQVSSSGRRLHIYPGSWKKTSISGGFFCSPAPRTVFTLVSLGSQQVVEQVPKLSKVNSYE